jgi:hypothetical protein
MEQYGFKVSKGSAHTARTIMLRELQTLFTFVNDPKALHDDYLGAIIKENCLGKPSLASRKETATRLTNLYSLDPDTVIFRALRYYWTRDPAGQQVQALLCAYARDNLLRTSRDYIFSLQESEVIAKEVLEELIEEKEPGRFSKKTLSSVVRNLISSWTQSGHLMGRANKKRTRAAATPGSLSYALYLGYLNGFRGQSMFTTEYVELLECSTARAIELAEIASRRGWITFKHIGNIMEVNFQWE